jgi:septal ring-binding cell division protein DamX
MLRDRNPKFLGGREILQYLEIYQDSESEGAAEKLTGVRYTIRIGTYSEKDRAEYWQRQMKTEGWDVWMTSKDIDGRRYWIVNVGSYPTIEKAQAAKQTLENTFSGSYRVVIRD